MPDAAVFRSKSKTRSQTRPPQKKKPNWDTVSDATQFGSDLMRYVHNTTRVLHLLRDVIDQGKWGASFVGFNVVWIDFFFPLSKYKLNLQSLLHWRRSQHTEHVLSSKKSCELWYLHSYPRQKSISVRNI